MEACRRKVAFSDKLLPEEACLGKLVGATLLSGPRLLEKQVIRPPTTAFLWWRTLPKGL